MKERWLILSWTVLLWCLPLSPGFGGGKKGQEKFEKLVKEGTEARQSNFFWKGATTLEKAWKINPQRGEVGLAAARCWVKIQEFAAAAYILRELVNFSDSEISEEAKKLMKKIEPSLEKLYQEKMKEAWKALERENWGQAEKLLQEALKVMPQGAEAEWGMARLRARQGKSKESVEALTRAVKKGLVEREKLIDHPDLELLWSSKKYLNLIRNIYGPKGVERVHARALHGRLDLDKFTPLDSQTFSAGGQSYTIRRFRHDPTGMVFLLIPGGSFTMGAQGNKGEAYSRELPPHKVTLSPFLMSQCEVTQKVWKKVMGKNLSHFQGEDRPVESVTWEEAVQFCKKLKVKLPSEAQWEYACRSGTTTPFYWGKIFPPRGGKYVWWSQNTENETRPVALKKANAFGLKDMIGNVSEFCRDVYYSSYQGAPSDGAARKGKSTRRVIRGGDWKTRFPSQLRSTYRSPIEKDSRDYTVGFRVIWELNGRGSNKGKDSPLKGQK